MKYAENIQNGIKSLLTIKLSMLAKMLEKSPKTAMSRVTKVLKAAISRGTLTLSLVKLLDDMELLLADLKDTPQ